MDMPYLAIKLSKLGQPILLRPKKKRSISGHPTVSPESAPTLNFLLGSPKKKLKQKIVYFRSYKM